MYSGNTSDFIGGGVKQKKDNSRDKKFVSSNLLFWSIAVSLILGLLLGFFIFSLSSQLNDNERVYLYSFSDENGHFFDFQQAYCTTALDEKLFCFSNISLIGSKLSLGISEELEKEVLGEASE